MKIIHVEENNSVLSVKTIVSNHKHDVKGYPVKQKKIILLNIQNCYLKMLLGMLGNETIEFTSIVNS